MDDTRTFALFMNQQGEGCDYTIGCGSRLVLLSATDYETAREEARKLVPDFFDNDERVPERMFIMEILHELDNSDIDWGDEEDEEDPERAEYERLKKKFG